VANGIWQERPHGLEVAGLRVLTGAKTPVLRAYGDAGRLALPAYMTIHSLLTSTPSRAGSWF
jgi:hypothetical protein